MKTKITICVMLIISALWSIKSNAQSTTNSNVWVNGDFLGYDATNGGGDLLFKVNNNTKMVLQNTTGYVGIGITNPGSTLQVNGSAAIGYSANTAGPSNGLCVKSASGIGTTSPNALFNIYDIKNSTYSTTPTASLRLDNVNASASDNQYSSLSFNVVSNGGNTAAGYMTLVQPTNSQSGANFTYILRDAGGTFNERMRIQYDGSVGIGTTTPNNLLQVSGLIDFDNTNYNTFLGNQAGNSISTGTKNSFLGYYAGYNNSKGVNNTFLGYQAGYSNTYANGNVAIGSNALYTQSYNPAAGSWASFNVAVGDNALYNNQPTSNSNGIYNSAVGYEAGYTNTTGDSNTFVGANADANAGTYTNCAAFGHKASALASNKMYFGDATVIGCYNATSTWGTFSDGRFKINVQQNVKGLEFINKLRPVTYNMDTKALDGFINAGRAKTQVVTHTQTHTFTDSTGMHTTTTTTYDTIPGYNPNDNGNFGPSTAIVHSGFIAQSVDSAAKACGFKSSIVSEPSNSREPYALSYAEFVVPLVKAVQELSKEVDSLKAAVKPTGSLQRTNNNGGNNNSEKNILDIKLALPDVPTLGEPQPNPNNGSTQIAYYLPENTSSAKIIFTDMLGKVMEESVLQPGYGLLNIDAQNLPSGIYSYSLVIDGKVIDNKKMMRSK